jgi:hypothetical protein
LRYAKTIASRQWLIYYKDGVVQAALKETTCWGGAKVKINMARSSTQAFAGNRADKYHFTSALW